MRYFRQVALALVSGVGGYVLGLVAGAAGSPPPPRGWLMDSLRWLWGLLYFWLTTSRRL